MKPGAYISGVGHAGLIGWLFFGPGFSAEPLPFEVTEVAVISGEDFAALTAGIQPQDPVVEAVQPAQPTVEETPEPVTPEPEPVVPEPVPAPEPIEQPAEETPPDVSQIEPLPPVAEVEDTPPVEPAAPAVDQAATIVVGSSVRPKPRPAPRVAPTPVAQPEPDADVSDATQEATQPDDTADVAVEEQDEAAPEAAATEIVTEAETEDRTEDVQVSAAPETSVRPSTRPNRPAPQTEAAQEADTQSSVNDALAEALASEQSETPAAPSGPPLTGGERDALRVAVSQCWNVGSLSSEALGTTVVVGMDMTQDGKPVSSTIRLISHSGGSQAAAEKAYQAARRAIIRCGSSGYNLPSEKYEQWQEIEMTFNPAKMRLK